MPNQNERILLIESDPEIYNIIADQSLKPLGYVVDVVESTTSGLQEIEKITPDLIITNLNPPGLSGKDLIVALASRWITIPIIVIANKGQETAILQALRLGAVDFLIRPIRETEVISVVENSLHKQKARNELERIKTDMAKQVSGFANIFSINKLLLADENQQSIFENIAHTAVQIAESDSAWIVTLDPKQCKFILQACVNVSEETQARLYLPYEDKFSALAGVSEQPIALHGEALKRFNNPDLLGAALAVAIKQNKQSVGAITITRKQAEPFSHNQRAMLELVAELTSLLLQNLQRFHLMEHSLVSYQQANVFERIEANTRHDLLVQTGLELRNPVKKMIDNVDVLFNQDQRRLNRDQAIALKEIREMAQTLSEIADAIALHKEDNTTWFEDIDLNVLIKHAVDRFEPLAKLDDINFSLDLSPKPAMVRVYASQISRIIEGLLSNAIKYSPPRGKVTIRTGQKNDHYIVTINDQGEVVEEPPIEAIFDKKSNILGYTGRRFGGIGISLYMIKEIISAYKGEVWAKSETDEGFSIAFSLPSKSALL